MKNLQSPEKAASTLRREKLVIPAIRQMFQQKTQEGKISVLLVHLIGAETERFAAAPVYAITGKGYLKSNRFDWLYDEEELEVYLRGEDGREYVDDILRCVNNSSSSKTCVLDKSGKTTR